MTTLKEKLFYQALEYLENDQEFLSANPRRFLYLEMNRSTLSVLEAEPDQENIFQIIETVKYGWPFLTLKIPLKGNLEISYALEYNKRIKLKIIPKKKINSRFQFL